MSVDKREKSRLTMSPGDIRFSDYDERGDDEATQPGDFVIEIRNRKPVVYTQPEGAPSGKQARNTRTTATDSGSTQR